MKSSRNTADRPRDSHSWSWLKAFISAVGGWEGEAKGQGGTLCLVNALKLGSRALSLPLFAHRADGATLIWLTGGQFHVWTMEGGVGEWGCRVPSHAT